MNEKQALGREAARHYLNEEARRAWGSEDSRASAAAEMLKLDPVVLKQRDAREAFLDGYAAGAFAALPERFVQPDLTALLEPLTQENATAQAMAYFESLMFTTGGDRRLAIQAALSSAIDIGTALAIQKLAEATPGGEG